MGMMNGEYLTEEEYEAFCGLSDALNAAIRKAGYKDMLDYLTAPENSPTWLYKRPYPKQ